MSVAESRLRLAPMTGVLENGSAGPGDDANAILQAAACGIMTIDLGGRVLAANRAFRALLAGTEVIVGCAPPYPFVARDDMGTLEDTLHRAFEQDGPAEAIEISLVRGDGQHVSVEMSVNRRDGSDGNATGWVLTAIDIHARKQFERRLARANRALYMLSGCNAAAARTGDETSFLREVCRIAVEIGGYCLAWIGFAEHDRGKSVRPVAHHGLDDGYVDLTGISWADNARGRGPTGTAIRNGEPSVARFIADDPRFQPWRGEAIRRGYASSAAVPLLDGGRAIGALNLYSTEPDAFDEVEISLLQDVGASTAHGIGALRARAARDSAQSILRKTLADREATILDRTREMRDANACLQTELRERARVEEALRRRLDGERLVGGISSRFVSASSESAEEEINRALGSVGEYAGADASGIGLLSADLSTVIRTYRWYAGNEIGPDLCGLSTEEFGWALDNLRRGEPLIMTTSVQAVPQPLWEVCQTRGWHSLVALPLFDGPDLLGVLAFGCRRAGRAWDADEIAVLRLTGELFGNALVRGRTERALAENRARLEESERDLRHFSRRLLGVREEEKRSLSAVLHHEVGSMAIGLTAQLHFAEEAIRRNDLRGGLEAMEEGKYVLERVVRRLKNLAVDLRPPDLDILGLTAALKLLVSQAMERTPTRIDCVIRVNDAEVGPEESIVVFRIAQEALNNIARHAEAKRVVIRLTAGSDGLTLRIRDNGKGFDADTLAASATAHMGLRAMREMASSVQGACEIVASPGHRNCSDIEVVAEAGSGFEAIEFAKSRAADVYLLDVAMPLLNGIETAIRLRREDPDAKIVMLSIHDSEGIVTRAIESGINGYVLKESAMRDIIQAVREVYRGKFFLSPGVSRFVVQGFLAKRQAPPKARNRGTLTVREREVLQLIAEGFTSKGIAQRLDVSINTVHVHKNNIRVKLGLHKQADLVRYAVREGIAKA
ncbi:MAG: GAF domain-containing protein [Candidatus Eisenbacteria bacterium]|nr:GAF domain-containing protein [Candidatus Eisenbacteria bacterium]